MRRDISTAGRAHGALMPGERGNALWGGGAKIGKKTTIVLATMVALIAVAAGQISPAAASSKNAYVSPALLQGATASPDQLFDVIVQGRKGKSSADVEKEVEDARKDNPANGSILKRKFVSISGVSATLSGDQLLKLSEKSWVDSITPDTRIELAAYSNTQIWPSSAGIPSTWSSTVASSAYPAIAIIDSGMTALSTFESRLVKSVNFVSWPGSNYGAYGHGTLVGSVAAGAATGYTGAEPRAKLVSLKVLDGNGVGIKSDIIAAVDWILQNKGTYNIRVANFSLNTAGESARYDALDKAVESLWLNGVVVVVAAGNYAVNGARSDVGFAPANDPFVITVGASDINNSTTRNDDYAAPWSAWGYTQDGFFKPELAAPGRRMNGAVPSGALLLSLFPTRVVAPNYMWMSGTSFAAPVVSGIAASLLAKNPSWTPDQVKGALMLKTSVPSGYPSLGALGVGVVNADAALVVTAPPNPNAGLNEFVYWNGSKYAFDSDDWYAEATTNASWNSASWSSASWSSASWSSASWSSASWSSASWSSASWSSASWSSASWSSNVAAE